jgi:hypothetical protein
VINLINATGLNRVRRGCRLDRKYLAKITDLRRIDLHSVDSLTRSIRTQDNFRIESFSLKEVSSPSPSEDRFENVPCVLIQSTSSTIRSTLIYINDDREIKLDNPTWIREAASGGLVVLGISLPKGEPLAKAVAKSLKGVSYLDLRRDIVDYGEIFFWGKEEHGVWGLISAVLDDRIKGVVIENPPQELTLASGESVKTVEVCKLLPPKRLVVLGHGGKSEFIDGVIKAYTEADRRENLRFEEETGRDVMEKIINWVLGRTC